MARSLVTRSLAVLGVTSLAVAGSASPLYAGSGSAATMGGPVTAFASWGSSEKTDFMAILKYCDANYHTKSTYQQSSGDYNTELNTRIRGGNPPDVGFISTPSTLAQYVAGNAIQPLTFLNQKQLATDYSSFWLNASKVNGKIYALYMKADNKSLVWYSPKKLTAGHYQVPKTWNDLVALSQKMVKDGKQPWAFGTNNSGWTITDFLENVYLQSAGPQMYQKWINHQIKWTDPSMVKAFQTMNQIIGNNSFIAGGRAHALGQAFDQAAKQMVVDPKVELYQEASFIGAILRGDLPQAVEGVDYNSFPFPRIGSTSGPTPVEVGPNAAIMLKDTPGARALMSCLADPKALAQWAKLGGFLSPNSAVPMSAYPDALTRKEAQMITDAGKAGQLVSDASDSMLPAIGSDYEFIALQKYFQNPSSYMSILSDLESHAAKAYGH
ncbi:MAG: sugar transporter substrate-binding protein [Chloroflexi bacterium]|nr:sugar transporter substrate-binding protein [Chloroflexota bacterium]